jgi:hypothetical protein
VATLSAATAGAATLLIRLCTLWFAVLVGVIALILFRRRVGLADDIAEQLRSPVGTAPDSDRAA